MIDGRRIITTVIGALVCCALVYADGPGACDPGRRHSGAVIGQAGSQGAGPVDSSGWSGVADLGAWPIEFLPAMNPISKQANEPQHPQALSEGTSSFTICLSALIGFGLFGSGHWVKRLSFGFVPEWYHDGGPFQIGHSHAVMPDSLSAGPIDCFIQPVCTAEDSIPQYRLRTIVSLWRESQFTPDVIASRGPPNVS